MAERVIPQKRSSEEDRLGQALMQHGRGAKEPSEDGRSVTDDSGVKKKRVSLSCAQCE